MIENLLQDIISFIVSPPWDSWLGTVRIAFIFFSLFLIGFIIFGLLKSSWLGYRYTFNFFEFITYKPFGTKKILKEWKKIMLRLDKGLESEYKLSVIEADNMLDEVLKKMRYEGEGLGDRLEKVPATILSNIEEVKQAHQIRNNIIHDPDYKLSLEEAKKTLEIFEKTLKNLDVF